jgi:FkbM family methyltransferase
MNVIRIIQNLFKHPLNRKYKLKALTRFLKWQVGSFLFKHPIVYPFIENSVLVVEKGMTGATGNVYNGLHEHSEMLFVLHFLRENDLFIDVGANIGSYTVLASANCKAKAIAFEPIPKTFQFLKRNVLVNEINDRVTLINKAVGAANKTLYFTDSLDAANHAISDEEKKRGQQGNTVECTTLDSVVMDDPLLIKIDVEGFETEVIKGGDRFFSFTSLKGIIIELNGSGARYGYSEKDIHEKLLTFGFTPFFYNPFKRELNKVEHWGTHNTLYLRDLDFIRQRILGAKAIQVNDQRI